MDRNEKRFGDKKKREVQIKCFLYFLINEAFSNDRAELLSRLHFRKK